MIIQNFRSFEGQHCETTATGTLLQQIDLNLSEPMLFGIGEGLGFIFWNMKNLPYPFIGGRIKPDELTNNLARNLKLNLIVKETSSAGKAWDSVKDLIDIGQAVGLKLDCYHLEYFTRAFHFAAHYIAMYGYDDTYAYLVDTKQQGVQVKTSLRSLALARAEKGPMSSKNLYYTISKKKEAFNLKNAILTAIKNNARDYLNPQISNLGYKGILKTGTEIIKWFKRSKNIKDEFGVTAMLMEKGGTGGALFRNLYRNFLKESYEILKIQQLKSGYEAFTEIALLWNSISDLFIKASESKDIAYIQKASSIMKDISGKEKKAMDLLSEIQ